MIRYQGPAALNINDRTFEVQADLFTDVSGGVYSWGGNLTVLDFAAVKLQGQSGVLAVPDREPRDVHVAVAELADSGVLLRITGADRAPYEQEGDIITESRGGFPVYRLPHDDSYDQDTTSG